MGGICRFIVDSLSCLSIDFVVVVRFSRFVCLVDCLSCWLGLLVRLMISTNRLYSTVYTCLLVNGDQHNGVVDRDRCKVS